MEKSFSTLPNFANQLIIYPIKLLILSWRSIVTKFKSSLDELSGGWTGFPTLITIFEKKGIKNLNLISLWELTIATGNNNFWFLKASNAAPCLGLFTRPFFCRVPSINIPIQLSFDNFLHAVWIVFLSAIPLFTGYAPQAFITKPSKGILKSSALAIKDILRPIAWPNKGGSNKEPLFEANYEDIYDLKELLDLSNKNLLNKNVNSWQKVLPLYPISPIN